MSNPLNTDNSATDNVTIREGGWVREWFDPIFCGCTIAFLSILTSYGNPFHLPVYLVYIFGVLAFQIYRHLIYEGDIPTVISIGVSCIGILAGLSTFYSLWTRIPNWDGYMHFVIHLLVGMMAVMLWQRYIDERMYRALASVGTVVLFGYIIELVEYLLWIIFGIGMAPLGMFYADTMEDFLWDIGGGMVGILIIEFVDWRKGV